MISILQGFIKHLLARQFQYKIHRTPTPWKCALFCATHIVTLNKYLAFLYPNSRKDN